MAGIGRSLHNLWTIARHEFALFFISPLVYFMGAVWLFFAGGFFSLSLIGFNQGAELSVSNMLSPLAFLTIFIAPALTMRLISNEISSGTHELLFTAPVRDWEIVVGKWLGVWAVLTIFILITLIYPAFLLSQGSPDLGLIGAGYLGLWLLWGALLAVGIFTSSLTQYELVAFVISLAIMIFLWLADSVANFAGSELLREVMSELTLRSHYQQTMLFRGIVRPLDIAYFIGLMAISLFLAAQILGTRRWRG